MRMPFSTRRPAFRRRGLDLGGVFLAVAPLTQAFEVFCRVVERVAVPMMDLTLPRFSATLTRALRFQSLRALTSCRARLRHPERVGRLCLALTLRTAEADRLEGVSSPRSCLRIGRILTFWEHRIAANLAGFRLVSISHLSAILSLEGYRLETPFYRPPSGDQPCSKS